MKGLVKLRWMALAGVVLAAGILLSFERGDDHSFKLAKNMDIFNSVVKELDMFYVDTIDADKIVRQGIDAMLYSLDPYTNYFPEDDPTRVPVVRWRSAGQLLYTNWLNYYVYQTTPYDLTELV